MPFPESIIISRTDSIGDIVLAMPVAGVLKKNFPGIKIALLGSIYTRDIANSCAHFDEFITLEDFYSKDVFICNKKPAAIIHLTTNAQVAKRALELKIPRRIGTSSRLYHWWTCNQLVHLSRKNSGLHEAQLNLKLLKPLGIKQNFSLEEIPELYGLTRIEKLSTQYDYLLKKDKFNIIIHPKSQGNAREWPIKHFIQLINMLDQQDYNILLSGVEKERIFINEIVEKLNKRVTVIAGVLSLGQFISLINQSDALLANSTGPLHIAAALGKNAIGLYPPLKPKDPERWGPVGEKSEVFVLKKNCNDCRNTVDACACMDAIEPLSLKITIDKLLVEKSNCNKAII